MAKLVACPSCSAHVVAAETSCPHCGGRVRNERGVVVRTAGAVLMGLSLAACPAEDDGDDTGAGSASSTDAGSTSSDPSGTTTGEPDPGSSSFGGAEYGVAETGGFTGTTGGTSTGTGSGSGSGTGTGSDTGSGTDPGTSTGVASPDYGVPETTGG